MIVRIIIEKIILTGGGTAGHVTPNIALLPRLKELGYDISYIGSYEGMEKGLIEQRIFHIMVFLPENYAAILIQRIFRIPLK